MDAPKQLCQNSICGWVKPWQGWVTVQTISCSQRPTETGALNCLFATAVRNYSFSTGAEELELLILVGQTLYRIITGSMNETSFPQLNVDTPIDQGQDAVLKRQHGLHGSLKARKSCV